VILASPRTLFRTFLDAETLAAWRTPDGMSGRITAFEGRVGGGYRMVLRYDGDDAGGRGKTGPREDEVIVAFVEMLAEDRVVERVQFVSDDPVFAKPMTLTTLFEKDRDGTKVTIKAEHVPAGISAEDHRAGLQSSLRNLARLTE
jgi:uncharacterized protein YndB with AHSA1/START domain